MDKVLAKALEMASGLHVYTDIGMAPRPATVDEIVSAAGRFAAFLRNTVPTSGIGYTDPPDVNLIPREPPIPAVPIKKSIHPDYIVCLNDGVKCKTLKRHLAVLGHSPESYRAYWGLPPDYPMTAPNYSKQRSELAKEIGLGTQARTLRRRASAR